jgi:hypothetical protein
MLLDGIQQGEPATLEDLKDVRIEAVYDIAERLKLRSFHTVVAKFLKPEGLGLPTEVFDSYVWDWLNSGDTTLLDLMLKRAGSNQADRAAISEFFQVTVPASNENRQTELSALLPSEDQISDRRAQSGQPAIIASDQTEGHSGNPAYLLRDCSAETGLAEDTLAGWVRAIERKGQAILYGPPGTGKTYVAERLAKHLVGGGDGFAELVQFHPAYAYEDFVQGIRPKTADGGGLSYPMVPGRFLEFCAKAAQRGDRCVLIIDEINRANLARVFGELMYLLEYRDREVPLAGGGTLRIPKNVRVIGTMNTADRSIALSTVR